MTNPYKTKGALALDIVDSMRLLECAMLTCNIIFEEGLSPQESRMFETLLNDAYTIIDRLSQHGSDFVLHNVDKIAVNNKTINTKGF